MAVLMVFSVFSYSNSNRIRIYLNDHLLSFQDQTPISMENGRIFVPLKSFSEYLGASLEWKDDKKILILSKGEKRISMGVNYKWVIADIPSKPISKENLDNDIIIIDQRAYAPLYFIVESLNYEVNRDDKSKNDIKIIMKSNK